MERVNSIIGIIILLIPSNEAFIHQKLNPCKHRPSVLFFGFPGQNKGQDDIQNTQPDQNEEPKKIRLSGLIQLITAGARIFNITMPDF